MKQEDFEKLKIGDKIWVWSYKIGYRQEKIVGFTPGGAAEIECGFAFSSRDCSFTKKEAIIAHTEREIEKENQRFGIFMEGLEKHRKNMENCEIELEKISNKIEEMKARLEKLQK